MSRILFHRKKNEHCGYSRLQIKKEKKKKEEKKKSKHKRQKKKREKEKEKKKKKMGSNHSVNEKRLISSQEWGLEDGFWNVRASFKVKSVVEIGTQMSIIRYFFSFFFLFFFFFFSSFSLLSLSLSLCLSWFLEC